MISRSPGVSLLMLDKNYEVFKEGGVIAVPMGGLISEYIRISWPKLKEIILNVPHGDMILLTRGFTGEKVGDAIKYFFKELDENFTEIQASMLNAEILSGFEEMKHSEYDTEFEWIKDLYDLCKNDEFYQQFVPADALIEVENDHTVRSLFIELYYVMLKYAVFVNGLLMNVTRTYEKYGSYNPEGEDTSKNDMIYSFFEEKIGAQNIDYKIALIEGEFTPIYTLKSALSVLLFDFANVCKNNIAFVKCKNCGKYFVPTGRSDSKYCSFTLEDDNTKTCKDVGAINTRAEKERTDLTTKEYRKVYMRLNMKLKRHPENEDFKTALQKLTSEVGDMRKKLECKEISEEEFIRWLNEF